MSVLPHHARAMTAYRTATETVAPAMAIVMLYDGAMQRLQLAKAAIAAGRIEERFNLVTRASAIIQGLQCQLDFAAGGEIAVILDGYYHYILKRMTDINLKNDPAICDELVDRLREMRTSWAAIAQGEVAAEPRPGPPADRERTAIMG